MFKSIPKEVKILSLAFLFIFLGYDGVQQYVTTFFQSRGSINVGFNSLILIYLFFTLSNLLSGVFVHAYGSRKSMTIGVLSYFIYIISILSGSQVVIYITSSLIGISASLLWTGQNSYLIRSSNKNSYGINSGFFYSLLLIGSGLGILLFGFLLPKLSFKLSFLIFSTFPLIGLFLIFKLRKIKIEQKTNKLQLVKKSVTSKIALRLGSFVFSFMFIVGLAIGILPLQIKDILGIEYIGPISSLFFMIPILSYIVGKISDKKGRKISITSCYLLSVIGLILLYLFNSISLVFGVIILAISRAIFLPNSSALIGDISTKNNLEFIAALFGLLRILGILLALILSNLIKTKLVYLIAVGIIFLSSIAVLPLFKFSLMQIRERLAKEIN